jgi:hypothetical protein
MVWVTGRDQWQRIIEHDYVPGSSITVRPELGRLRFKGETLCHDQAFGRRPETCRSTAPTLGARNAMGAK